MISKFRADARSFIEKIQPPVILGEIQNVPEVLNYVRTRIDRYPHKKGQRILTGSQEAPLMRGSRNPWRGGQLFSSFFLCTREASKVPVSVAGAPRNTSENFTVIPDTLPA